MSYSSNISKDDNRVYIKGSINSAADFPTLADVNQAFNNGAVWTYSILSDVTDNDVTKTNTGQSFVTDSEISWTGANWFVWGVSPVDKMDKQVAATEDNFVAFDGSGNSKDSGNKSTSFAAAVHDHSNAGSGGKLLQANSHESPDTDVAQDSIHHTIEKTTPPSALGVAAPGNATKPSASNHVHIMPSAADVGADAFGVAQGLITGHDHSGATNGPKLSESNIDLTQFGSPSNQTLQDYIQSFGSSAVIDGGDITENAALDGTIDIAECEGFVKVTDAQFGVGFKFFKIAATTSFAVDAGSNKIYAEYNDAAAGSIAWAKGSNPNHTTQVVVGEVYKDDLNHVHILQGGMEFTNGMDKVLKYHSQVQGMQRVSGLVSSEATEDLCINTTAGVLWKGINRFTTEEIDTSDEETIADFTATNTLTVTGDITADLDHGGHVYIHGSTSSDGGYYVQSATYSNPTTTIVLETSPLTVADADKGHLHTAPFLLHYNDGAWQDDIVAYLPVTQYNNYGVGLANLGVGRFGVYWIFMSFDGHLHAVYGLDSYKLAKAEDAVLPGNLPDLIADFCIPIAKVLIEKDDTAFTGITTPWQLSFEHGSVDNHDDLGNLQGGAADEYYHLTAAELAALHVAPAIYDAAVASDAAANPSKYNATTGYPTLSAAIIGEGATAPSIYIAKGTYIETSTNPGGAGNVVTPVAGTRLYSDEANLQLDDMYFVLGSGSELDIHGTLILSGTGEPAFNTLWNSYLAYVRTFGEVVIDPTVRGTTTDGTYRFVALVMDKQSVINFRLKSFSINSANTVHGIFHNLNTYCAGKLGVIVEGITNSASQTTNGLYLQGNGTYHCYGLVVECNINLVTAGGGNGNGIEAANDCYATVYGSATGSDDDLAGGAGLNSTGLGIET